MRACLACVDGKEQIPLNRIIQRPNGDYFKCASDGLDGLELRALTKDESEDNLKKKVRFAWGPQARTTVPGIADPRILTCMNPRVGKKQSESCPRLQERNDRFVKSEAFLNREQVHQVHVCPFRLCLYISLAFPRHVALNQTLALLSDAQVCKVFLKRVLKKHFKSDSNTRFFSK